MKNAHILLVEDNEGDIVLTRDALESRAFVSLLTVVKNGKQALDFVFQEGDHSGAERPDLILLDVNLPLKNGHEVLQCLKNDDRYKQIPVIMLTTSSSERDIAISSKNHANCYITKPIEMDDYIAAMDTIEEFWNQWIRIPEISSE